jgi:ribonuclease D
MTRSAPQLPDFLSFRAAGCWPAQEIPIEGTICRMAEHDPRVTFVADPAAVERVCAAASAAGVVAVDTESNSLYAYFARLCVTQLSFDDTSVVLDTLALSREALRPLTELLANPHVVKVLHGADYDLRSLDRELGARVVGLRDTQAAAQLLGMRQTGLAALVLAELGVSLDKQHQLADWAQRPLPPAVLAYAVADTAHLVALAERLERRLGELGRLTWWAEECAALETIRWEAPPIEALAFERLRGASKLKGLARDRIAALHAWRERVAAELDRPPFKVMQPDVMLALAESPPEDLAALAKVRGVSASVARHHGATLVKLLKCPGEAPPRRQTVWVKPAPARSERVRQAGAVRDSLATELALDPAVLAPRAALEAVVDRLPSSEVGLVECLGRRWRAGLLADGLLALTAAWRAEDDGDAEPH